MKRILITITLVLTSVIGFSQLNLDGITYRNQFKTLDDAINEVIRLNPNEDITSTVYDVIKFDVPKRKYEYKYVIFTGKDNEFLKLVFFNRSKSNADEIWEGYSISKIQNYFKNSKLVAVKIDDLNHKIIMDDDSYVEIIMRDKPHSRYKGEFETTVYGSINIYYYNNNNQVGQPHYITHAFKKNSN